MSSQSGNIPQYTNDRTRQFKDILARWQAFYEDPLVKAIQYLYKEGKTQDQVAEIIGFDRAIISRRFHKSKLMKEAK